MATREEMDLKNREKCWICGKPNVTYIDFTFGPLGNCKYICSNDPEQGCYKATALLLVECERRQQAEYTLREVGRKLQAIWQLKYDIKVLTEGKQP